MDSNLYEMCIQFRATPYLVRMYGELYTDYHFLLNDYSGKSKQNKTNQLRIKCTENRSR